MGIIAMNDINKARTSIERLGLKISQQGIAWRVRGPGVDVLVTSLDQFGPEDMIYHRHRGSDLKTTTERESHGY